MRKMERIAQLDQEVAELKSQNTMLGQVSWLPSSTVLYLYNNLCKYTTLKNTATRSLRQDPDEDHEDDNDDDDCDDDNYNDDCDGDE